MPGQGPFTLSTVPVIRGEQREVRRTDSSIVQVTDLELRIDEGTGSEPWQQVSDFFASGPDDMHYVLDRDRVRSASVMAATAASRWPIQPTPATTSSLSGTARAAQLLEMSGREL